MDEELEALILHRHPQLIDQCCELINSEWPRSHTARRRGLESSCDTLPTCLVLISKKSKHPRVVGHSKISAIPSIPRGAFIESVVIDKNLRGKGLGRILMDRTEKHMLSIGLTEAYLSTYDQQGFYSKLGYDFCERVSIYGSTINFCEDSKETMGSKEKISAASPIVSSTCSNAPPPPPPPPMPISKVPKPPQIIFSSANKSSGRLIKDFMKKILVPC